MDFSCVEGCSKCCIEREYYPTVKFGKIGVLVMPEEVQTIETLAKKHSVEAVILPRIGVSEDGRGPSKILAYQLMGRDPNGNTCPFLDTDSTGRSPHGGYKCRIYQERPLACRAYPLIETIPAKLDPKCKFCESCSNVDGNINSEIESLVKIKAGMKTDGRYIWRFATGVGEAGDRERMESGWFLV